MNGSCADQRDQVSKNVLQKELRSLRIEEFEKYFETIELAKQAIGINRVNRKHLQRLEEIKQILLEYYVSGATVLDFDYEFSYGHDLDKLENWVSSNEVIKRVWLRSDGSKCSIPGRPWLRSKDIWENEPPTAGIVVGLTAPTISSISDSSLESCDSLKLAAAIVA